MRRNYEGELLAEFFALVAQGLAKGVVTTAEIIDEIINKEIKKAEIRENLEILEYKEEEKYRKAIYTPDENKERDIINKIQIDDPDFDGPLFEEYAADLFKKFYKAFCDDNMNSMRKYVNINVIELFNILAHKNTERGIKEFFEVKTVNYVDFFGYHKENNLDIVSVAIGIVFKNYKQDENGQVIGDADKYLRRETYVLSFARKEGARTLKRADEIINAEIHCPNCNAIIENNINTCSHCGTTLYNSTENWLLTYIEQL